MRPTIYCAPTVCQILGRNFIHVTTNFDSTLNLSIVNTILHMRKQSLRDFCDIKNYVALQNQNSFLFVPKVTLFQLNHITSPVPNKKQIMTQMVFA